MKLIFDKVGPLDMSGWVSVSLCATISVAIGELQLQLQEISEISFLTV